MWAAVGCSACFSVNMFVFHFACVPERGPRVCQRCQESASSGKSLRGCRRDERLALIRANKRSSRAQRVELFEPVSVMVSVLDISTAPLLLRATQCALVAVAVQQRDAIATGPPSGDYHAEPALAHLLLHQHPRCKPNPPFGGRGRGLRRRGIGSLVSTK